MKKDIVNYKNFYVDAVNLVGKPKFCFGNTIEKLNIKTHFSELDVKDKQYIDMPNQLYYVFLNPRDIFIGLSISYDF